MAKCYMWPPGNVFAMCVRYLRGIKHGKVFGTFGCVVQYLHLETCVVSWVFLCLEIRFFV